MEERRREVARKQIEEEEWRFLVKRAISELTGEVRRVGDALERLVRLLAEKEREEEGKSRLPGE